MSWQLIHGDARHLSHHLEPASVDAIITSPPYFALRSYRDGGEHYSGQIGSEPTLTDFLDALIECTRDWLKVLRPGGSIFVNLGDKYANAAPSGSAGRKNWNADDLGPRWATGTVSNDIPPIRTDVGGVRTKSLMGLPWRYAIRCIDELGLILRAEIVWSKPNGLPESVTDRVRRSHEQWFHFTTQPRYFAGIDEIREPHADLSYPNGRGHWQPGPKGEVHGQNRGSGSGPEGLTWTNPLGKLPGSVWTIEETDDTIRGLLEAVAAGAIDADEATRLLRPDLERSHEQWFHFTTQPRYFAGIDEIREPYDVPNHNAVGTVSASQRRRDRAVADDRDATRAGLYGIRTESPLGKLPGSVWTIPSEPLNPPQHLNIDHYAAYPTEWPRRLILGWTPTGYCTECGEPRRVVTNVEYVTVAERLTNRRVTGSEALGDSGHGRPGGPDAPYGDARKDVTILGYQCTCPTPDAPTRPAVVVDPFCGTGTTVAVAHHLCRHGIGVDLSRDYLRLAEWRCTSDEALRAKVLDRSGIPRPAPPAVPGQLDLFG